MELKYKGKTIHYRVQGKGPALVLIHGFTESSAIWDDFTGELADTFQVITPDLPGHGQSECIGEVHTMLEMAAMVRELLDHLKVKCCVMIGHSMGGYVALSFGRQYAQMLVGLGLFHSTALADSPEASQNRKRAIALIKKNRQDFLFGFIPELFAPKNREGLKNEIDTLVRTAGQMTVEAIVAAQEGMRMRVDGRDVLFSSDFPVMFIAGQQDSRVPFESIQALSGIPKTSYSLFLKNAGHMGYLEARNETLGFVKFFAKTCMKPTQGCSN